MQYEMLKDESYKNLGGIDVRSSTYTTEENKFLNLRNYTFVKPGSLTSRPGVASEATLPVATFAICPVNNIEYIKNSGASFKLFDSGKTLYSRDGNAAVAGSLIPGTTALALDWVTQNDYLYYANGHEFRRFDGTLSVLWNVIPYVAAASHVSLVFLATFHTSLVPVNGVTAVIGCTNWLFSVGGFRNHVSLSTVEMQTRPYQGIELDSAAAAVAVGATIVAKGRWLVYGFLYAYSGTNDLGVSYGIVSMVMPGASFNDFSATDQYRFYNDVRNSTAILVGQTVINGITQNFLEFDHFTTSVDYRFQKALSITPRYLETYNNMLFMAGMSGAPSTVWNSNVGTPEQVDEENFFEVRTNNGDVITGMVAFQDSLIIFKKYSVHELVGTSPEQLDLKDINLEYGCVSNRGFAVFENKLWFVDEKGIVEYNGANFIIVSDPIDEYLDQIDKTKLIGLHVKKLNQVWFSADNKIFAYDYIIGAWTIYDNLQLDNRSGGQVLSYGATIADVTYWQSGASYHQSVRFNDLLNTDFGVGITLLMKTRFHKRLGDSTTEMWRRFYVNSDQTSPQSATIRLYPNYGESIYATRGVTLEAYQERIDFGVPAKSLSIELLIQSSQSIRVNGYTIESRYLRSV